MGRKRDKRRGRLLTKAADDFSLTAVGGPPGLQSVPGETQRWAESFGAAGNQSATLGPGVPASAQPLDRTGQPRQWQYRVGWNIPSLPGEGRPVDLSTLRQLADTYDLLRKAIEVRKTELAACRLDIIARDPDRRRARDVITNQQGTIARIREFFALPDKIHTWQGWLRMLAEDHYVIDGPAIAKQRTYGGDLWALNILDGATIKPLLNIEGRRPQPPDPAYQQYLYGSPRFDFTADELIYAVQNVRATSVYGYSPVEQFIWHITLALKFNRWTLDFFTDGTIPEGVAEAPTNYTPDMLEDLNLWWDNLLAGDTRALRKLQFVPGGFKFHELKPFSFDDDFARWLLTITCVCMDVTPQELGFEPKNSGLGGSGFAQEQRNVQKRKGLQADIAWLCGEVLNPIIWYEFGATDLQAVLLDDNTSEDAEREAKAREANIRSGIVSIDQVVEESGGDPPGIGRMLVVGNTVLFEPDLIQGTQRGAAALGLIGGGSQVQQAAPAPAAAPAGQSIAPIEGQQAVQQAEQDSREQDEARRATDAELERFLRFVGKRRNGSGLWRDFVSDVFPAPLLSDLNRAARTGADSERLRHIAGWRRAPEHTRKQIASTRDAYTAFGKRLAVRVAEELERNGATRAN